MEFTIEVDKIMSYQTGVYKNGHNTFKKREFSECQKTIQRAVKSLAFLDRDAPIKVELIYYFAMTKSWSKKKKLASANQYCMKNIDLDNITKGVIDAIFTIDFDNTFIKGKQRKKYHYNDKDIVECTQSKYWANIDCESDYIVVKIKNCN